MPLNAAVAARLPLAVRPPDYQIRAPSLPTRITPASVPIGGPARGCRKYATPSAIRTATLRTHGARPYVYASAAPSANIRSCRDQIARNKMTAETVRARCLGADCPAMPPTGTAPRGPPAALKPGLGVVTSPFGLGPHACPGGLLVRLQATAALRAAQAHDLLGRFRAHRRSAACRS